MNSKALTKIQSIILIAIIVVATVGVAVYVLDGGEEQSSETIKIGVCAGLDYTIGRSILQGAQLAAEQVNGEGGVLGRNFEIVSEDDSEDIGNEAFTKLISVDKADFIITQYGLIYREIASQYKKILFTVGDVTEELTQGVLDDYDKYKYYFRSGSRNETALVDMVIESIVACRNYTGFNKVGFLYPEFVSGVVSSIIEALEEYGFDVVLSQSIAYDSIDYSSYFANAEAAGTEILYSYIFGTVAIPYVKEYFDRQSPMIMWGYIEIGSMDDFWEITEGKCNHITNVGFPVVAGYPLTSKTVPTQQAYLERWGEPIHSLAAATYDTVRFILPDAIKRAGTIETEAVIGALEETKIETSLCRNFVFTPSHDIMISKVGPNKPTEDYYLVCFFQWQDGVQVPVYPIELMEEAGATYMFPDWHGPWDNLD